MSQALLTGATGLLSHQRKLDVVANNLANLNTTAYKSQRILFSDLLYTTNQPGSFGDGANIGGTNPQQTGFGVQIGQTGRDHSQGVLSATGATFDFAIQGDGFFVTSDGTTNYTRAGAFALDGRGFLVDPGNGAYVQRFGSVGEGLDGNPAFQTSGENAIRIPMGSGIGGSQTANAAFLGNLPAITTPPQAEVLAAYRPYVVAGLPASLTTLLNNLDSNTVDYTVGDQLKLAGFTHAGAAVNSTLAVTATTTVGDLVDFYNSVLVDGVASLDSNGALQIQANNVGISKLKLELSDGLANTGETDFANHILLEQVKGKDGDVAETTMQVFDSRGQAHSLNVEFKKVDPNTWNATFSLINNTGTLTDNIVRRIEFGEDGKFLAVQGTNDGDPNIELNFDSLSLDQNIDIDFSGLTHLATGFSSSIEQDGFPPGSLVAVNVTQSGLLEGIASNGRRVPLAQLAVANFINVQGLEAKGQNYYAETANSGAAQIGTSLAGSNGFVRGGQLEASNVDVAFEFTQLIVAQRGFSANARTITVASEVLQELVNLLR